AATAAGGPTITANAAAVAAPRPRVAWTPTASVAGPTTAPALAGAPTMYTVQVSTDNGGTWQAVGVGLTTPEVTLDPQLLAGHDTIQVRVTATNGFRAKS